MTDPAPIPHDCAVTDSPQWRYRVDYPRRNCAGRLTSHHLELQDAIEHVARAYPDRASVYDRTTGYHGKIEPSGPLWKRVTWHGKR